MVLLCTVMFFGLSLIPRVLQYSSQAIGGSRVIELFMVTALTKALLLSSWSRRAWPGGTNRVVVPWAFSLSSAVDEQGPVVGAGNLNATTSRTTRRGELAQTAAPRSSTPTPPTANAASAAVTGDCGNGNVRPELLSIVTWNVAGLRGFLKRDVAVANLRRVVRDHAVDVVCLQETKLQECHVEAVREVFVRRCLPSRGEGEEEEEEEEEEETRGPQLQRDQPQHQQQHRSDDGREDRGGSDDGGAASSSWQTFFACSVARKGYSGVLTAWNTQRVTGAAFDGGVELVGDDEGRTVTLRASPAASPASTSASASAPGAQQQRHAFTLVNCYVPNSGERLQRLECVCACVCACVRACVRLRPACVHLSTQRQLGCSCCAFCASSNPHRCALAHE